MSIKSISRICGVLYLSTVAAWLVSNLLMKGQLVDAENIPNTLKLVADNAVQYRLAVFIDFMGMVGVMALVFSLFYILKPINLYVALLALGWRIGEVVIQAGAKIPEYLLLTLSQSVASAPGNGIAEVDYLGQMLITGSTRALWLSFVFLAMGSIFNNFLFYRGKAIPVVLAIFGLIGAASYTLGAVLPLIFELPESTYLGLMLPLVLFELSLGFYLAVFGIKEKTV